MIWSPCRQSTVAAALVRKEKNSTASSGHAATHSACMVKQESRTQE
jgi:hypothetical protein